jgi:hypothetical protein
MNILWPNDVIANFVAHGNITNMYILRLILVVKYWYKVSKSNCENPHLALDHEFGF